MLCENIPEQLVSTLRALAKKFRPIRTSCARLAYDMAVLLCGARPCVMLDYVRLLELESVVQLVLHVNTTPCFQANWCVLTYDGCHYIANLPKLQGHLEHLLAWAGPSCNILTPLEQQLQAAQTPALIGFIKDGAGLKPTLLSEQATKAVLQCLQTLRNDLQNNPGFNLITPSGQTGIVVVLDLTSTAAKLLPPTLNGLLLCYPVVYAIEGGMQGAAAAACCLSCQHLTLFELTATPPAQLCSALERAGLAPSGTGSLSSGHNKKKGQNVCDGSGRPKDVVCSFTAPSCMCGPGCASAAKIEAWSQEMQCTLHASALDWSELACVPSLVGTCVVNL